MKKMATNLPLPLRSTAQTDRPAHMFDSSMFLGTEKRSCHLPNTAVLSMLLSDDSH